MFNWFKERKRIKALTDSARVYLWIHYNETDEPESGLSFTSETKERPLNDRGVIDRNDPNIKYSMPSHENDSQDESGKTDPRSPASPDPVDESKKEDPGRRESDLRQTDAHHGFEDNYDSKSIQTAMNELSATGYSQNVLKVLEKSTNMSFVDKLLEHIKQKHLRDTDVYKSAQVDRRLFSKIVSDRSYKPAKDTCIALCLAMELTLSETNDLLSRAGYTLSHSSKRDVVLEYFFKECKYSVIDVNEVLYRLDQKTLGRM